MLSSRLAPLALASIVGVTAVVAAGAQASSTATPPKKRALVTWKVEGERFRSYVNVPADIVLVRDAIRAGTAAGIPVGRVYRGTRENTGHGWHVRNVRLAEVTIELCDGVPSTRRRRPRLLGRNGEAVLPVGSGSGAPAVGRAVSRRAAATVPASRLPKTR